MGFCELCKSETYGSACSCCDEAVDECPHMTVEEKADALDMTVEEYEKSLEAREEEEALANIGLWGVCEWWLKTYPADIFVTGPKEIVEIRALMEQLLKRRQQKSSFDADMDAQDPKWGLGKV